MNRNNFLKFIFICSITAATGFAFFGFMQMTQAAGTKPNLDACTVNDDCVSGSCSAEVCCDTGQCGWGDGVNFVRQCVANSETRENAESRMVCRSGQWKIPSNGWGCAATGYDCESGNCQKIGDAYYCRSGCAVDPGVSQSCASGESCPSGTTCNNSVCCPSGYCGWGDGTNFTRQCVADGETRENAESRMVCRSGQWKIPLNGWGCAATGYDCESGSCQDVGGVYYCSLSLPMSSYVFSTPYDTGNYCQGTCRSCASLNYVCGTVGDNCGGVISCAVCPSGQTCSDGQCVLSTASCTSNHSQKCNSGNLYWYDSCGNRGDLVQNCGANILTSNYRCSGNWLQQEMVATDCVNNACTQGKTWTNFQDCSKTGKICKNNTCGASDALPPALSGLGPSGTLYDLNTILTVTTSESADCRYSWYNKNFDAMTLAFDTNDRLTHTVPSTLANYGSYSYYVRCRDDAGNINPVAGRIIFRYATNEPVEHVDTTPPAISALAPAGEVTAAAITLTAVTDEDATCKYDTVDKTYDSMANTIAGDGTDHNENITLPAAGNYNYYIRCRDDAGNKNKTSAKISFSYTPPKEGPKISGPMPEGNIYQANVTLAVNTDKPADCRYSTADKDYDQMTDTFSTSDGQQQMAIVALNDYGRYSYFVRCQDAGGNKSNETAIISFEYVNPNPSKPSAEQPETPVNTDTAAPVSCAEYKVGNNDSVCDNRADCVCDPDCGANGQPQDIDCINAANQTGSGNSWMILVIVLVILLVVAAAVFIVLKKKGIISINPKGAVPSQIDQAPPSNPPSDQQKTS